MLAFSSPSEYSEFMALRANLEKNKVTENPATQKKRAFTVSEDAMIKFLTSRAKGDINWKEVAAQIPGKTTRQCRERYQTYLAPGINNSPWTRDEDELLIHKYREFGSKWSLIAQFFNGRSPNALKNRYNVHIIHRGRGTRSHIDIPAIPAPKQQKIIEKPQTESPPILKYPPISNLIRFSLGLAEENCDIYAHIYVPRHVV